MEIKIEKEIREALKKLKTLFEEEQNKNFMILVNLKECEYFWELNVKFFEKLGLYDIATFCNPNKNKFWFENSEYYMERVNSFLLENYNLYLDYDDDFNLIIKKEVDYDE